MDFGKMTLKELIKTRNKLNKVIDDSKETTPGIYLSSDEGRQLIQDYKSLKIDAKELESSSVKLRIEVDLDLKIECENLDWSTDNAYISVYGTGKLANANLYPKKFVSEAKTVIDNALDEVCEDILLFDPQILEAVKQYKAKLEAFNKKFEVAQRDYGVNLIQLRKVGKK